MKMQFFSIPVLDSASASDALNAFLTTHRVVQVERQFVVDGANSLWSVCVSYIDSESRPANATALKWQRFWSALTLISPSCRRRFSAVRFPSVSRSDFTFAIPNPASFMPLFFGSACCIMPLWPTSGRCWTGR